MMKIQLLLKSFSQIFQFSQKFQNTLLKIPSLNQIIKTGKTFALHYSSIQKFKQKNFEKYQKRKILFLTFTKSSNLCKRSTILCFSKKYIKILLKNAE